MFTLHMLRFSRDQPCAGGEDCSQNKKVKLAPGRANGEHAKKGVFAFSIAEFFDKGITMGSGQAPVKKYNEDVRDLIVNGRAKPSKIISHRIPIEQAPDGYEKFDRRIDGYTKVVIRFKKQKAA
jgi:glutathione-independent formaldehyde dehydrogenase